MGIFVIYSQWHLFGIKYKYTTLDTWQKKKSKIFWNKQYLIITEYEHKVRDMVKKMNG